MSTPEVSVIIPCIKNGALLQKCIGECLAQSTDVEVIVLTESPFAEINAKFNNSNLHFLLCESINMSAKRNRGVSIAKARYLAFIDSDAYPASDWLKNGIAELKQDSSLGGVGGPELAHIDENWGERIVGLAGKSFFINGANAFRKREASRRFFPQLPSCNLILRKEDYLAVGGMNEDLYVAEDYEFTQKLGKAGKKLLFSPEVAVHHRNRSPRNFLVQRLVRGIAAAQIIRSWALKLFQTKKAEENFRWELLLAPAFVIFIFAGLFLLTNSILKILYFSVLAGYLGALILESFKISTKPRETLAVFLALFFGTQVSGLSALLALCGANIDARKFYRNLNDL